MFLLSRLCVLRCLTLGCLFVCVLGEPAVDAGRGQHELPYGGPGQRPGAVCACPPGLHGHGGAAAGVRSLGGCPLRERPHPPGLRSLRRTHGYRHHSVSQESQGRLEECACVCVCVGGKESSGHFSAEIIRGWRGAGDESKQVSNEIPAFL